LNPETLVNNLGDNYLEKYRKDEINQALSRIAKYNGIEILDKNDFVCDMKAKTCDGITDDGFKSFYDYGHFTLEGARFFGQRIHETNWLKID
jgi:lysophospholipase L1-like esterase